MPVPAHDAVEVPTRFPETVRFARRHVPHQPGAQAPVLGVLKFSDEPGEDAVGIRLEAVGVIQPEILPSGPINYETCDVASEEFVPPCTKGWCSER